MKRYRLRFLLQEIDLAGQATIIGRSPECHVTIEDPLVSRQHARIVVDEQGATVEDLGSRNGLKLNGKPFKGIARLKDNDRLRIGTQELVFCEVRDGAGYASKTTGFLRHCANCHLPYPQEMLACPSCGSNEQTDEDTMTGEISAAEHSWSLQLLNDLLEKSVVKGRSSNVTRTLQRIATQVDELALSNKPIDPKQLAALAEVVLRASVAVGDVGWLAWMLRVLTRVRAAPPPVVVDALPELVRANRGALLASLEGLLTALRSEPRAHGPELARLEQLFATERGSSAERGPEATAPNPAVPR